MFFTNGDLWTLSIVGNIAILITARNDVPPSIDVCQKDGLNEHRPVEGSRKTWRPTSNEMCVEIVGTNCVILDPKIKEDLVRR